MANAAVKPIAQALNVGDKAPDFSMPANGGNHVSLDAFKGKNIVLYFYPKDDTPGCTTQAKDFRDVMKDFEAANTIIIGVSKDSVGSHDKFKEKHCLPFALGSDVDGSVCDAYNTWVEKSMYGKSYMGIERSTFLIDANGIIKNIWRKVKVTDHVSEVLRAAQAL